MKTKFLLVVMMLLTVHWAWGDNSEKLDRMTFLADSLYASGRVDSALAVSDDIIRLALQDADPRTLMSCYTSRGVYLRSSGKTDQAVKAYDEAIRYAEQVEASTEDDVQNAAVLYNNLSTLYLDMKLPDRAEEYASKAASWADRSEDKLFRSQIYGVASSVFISRKRYDEAKNYLRKAVRLSRETGQADAELSSLGYYILALQRSGASEQEIRRYVRQAESVLPRVKSSMTLMAYYQILFSVCRSGQDHAGAIAAARGLLAVEGIENYPFVLNDIYNNLHEVYLDVHDYENAYRALEKAVVLNDSLFKAEKVKQLEELSVKYETQKKEMEIRQLTEKRQKETMRFRIVLGSVLLVLVILSLLSAYFLQRQKLRIERQRRESEAQRHEFEQLQYATEQKLTRKYLKQLDADHARLAKELHDGICNDLYAIEMNIRSEHLEQADKWVASLQHSREGIRRVSHELLPPVFQEATIDEVLAGYLENFSASGVEVRFSALPEGTDWSVLPDEMALNIYRIVQEAVGNALKHAHAGRIEVVLSWKLPDLEIIISDDGKGTKAGRGGIGMQMMQERAAALKGKLSCRSGNEGTVVQVQVPLF